MALRLIGKSALNATKTFNKIVSVGASRNLTYYPINDTVYGLDSEKQEVCSLWSWNYKWLIYSCYVIACFDFSSATLPSTSSRKNWPLSPRTLIRMITSREYLSDYILSQFPRDCTDKILSNYKVRSMCLPAINIAIFEYLKWKWKQIKVLDKRQMFRSVNECILKCNKTY